MNCSSSFPEIVEIQFHNLCNADCSICPYPKFAEITERDRMSENLREKLLAELVLHKNKVRVFTPYLNNEPFLDPAIYEILRRVRKEASNLEIHVSTNISPLKQRDMVNIIEERLIDHMRVSFFGGIEESYKQLMPKLDFRRNLEKLKTLLEIHKDRASTLLLEVVLVLVPWMDVGREVQALKDELVGLEPNFRFFGYLDRCDANDIKNDKLIDLKRPPRLLGCNVNFPRTKLCIRTNGDCVLCPQDWFGSIVIGNVTNNTMMDVWNSSRRTQVLDFIEGRAKPPTNFLCHYCKLARIEDHKGDEVLNFRGDTYMTDQDKKILSKL